MMSREALQFPNYLTSLEPYKFKTAHHDNLTKLLQRAFASQNCGIFSSAQKRKVSLGIFLSFFYRPFFFCLLFEQMISSLFSTLRRQDREFYFECFIRASAPLLFVSFFIQAHKHKKNHRIARDKRQIRYKLYSGKFFFSLSFVFYRFSRINIKFMARWHGLSLFCFKLSVRWHNFLPSYTSGREQKVLLMMIAYNYIKFTPFSGRLIRHDMRPCACVVFPFSPLLVNKSSQLLTLFFRSEKRASLPKCWPLFIANLIRHQHTRTKRKKKGKVKSRRMFSLAVES